MAGLDPSVWGGITIGYGHHYASLAFGQIAESGELFVEE